MPPLYCSLLYCIVGAQLLSVSAMAMQSTIMKAVRSRNSCPVMPEANFLVACRNQHGGRISAPPFLLTLTRGLLSRALTATIA